MKILLLGGTGLLGHNVLNVLLGRGHEVHALLRNRQGLRTEDFPQADGKLEIFVGSLLDEEALTAAAQGCEAIVNCAGVTDMSLLRYEDYLPVNRDLCGRLVALMERLPITRLVHTSTANTIGYGTAQSPADESLPMRPPFSQSYYARSKREGEELLLRAAKEHPDWHVVIVNPGFMVGGFDVKPSSGVLLLAAYRKPLMVVPRGGKSFLHVADAAEAIANALQEGQQGGRYLLTGESLSLGQFYRLQAQVCGYKQRQLPLPNALLAVAGGLGDLLRFCGLRTQLSTRNVRQLMVREYYSNRRAVADLHLHQTPIRQAIADFFAWREAAEVGGNGTNGANRIISLIVNIFHLLPLTL